MSERSKSAADCTGPSRTGVQSIAEDLCNGETCKIMAGVYHNSTILGRGKCSIYRVLCRKFYCRVVYFVVK